MHYHSAPAVKAIAFVLPQFHPIPENDLWWGRGFTEWTYVRRAAPLFPGHAQPHVPADLGFYDLRDPQVRAAQAGLARRHGIHGFCYFHYWLHGKRLLELPVNEILRTGEPDFPFCLCWANHNWTRNWDDGNRELLFEQRYSLADHLDHIRWLAKVFLDERYIRIDGKPLLLLFRTATLRYVNEMVVLWREQARKLGAGEIFLAEIDDQDPKYRGDPRTKGLDALVESMPDFPLIFANPSRCPARQVKSHQVFEYEQVMKLMLGKACPPYRFFRCVIPSWDNSARHPRRGKIIHGSTPELYERWLGQVVKDELGSGSGDRVVFINAWNEWAEGCHLEPCRRWGHAYLQATRRALVGGVSPATMSFPQELCA
jgi:lipopolysaccharide biosynthesis protein